MIINGFGICHMLNVCVGVLSRVMGVLSRVWVCCPVCGCVVPCVGVLSRVWVLNVVQCVGVLSLYLSPVVEICHMLNVRVGVLSRVWVCCPVCGCVVPLSQPNSRDLDYPLLQCFVSERKRIKKRVKNVKLIRIFWQRTSMKEVL